MRGAALLVAVVVMVGVLVVGWKRLSFGGERVAAELKEALNSVPPDPHANHSPVVESVDCDDYVVFKFQGVSLHDCVVRYADGVLEPMCSGSGPVTFRKQCSSVEADLKAASASP